MSARNWRNPVGAEGALHSERGAFRPPPAVAIERAARRGEVSKGLNGRALAGAASPTPLALHARQPRSFGGFGV